MALKIQGIRVGKGRGLLSSNGRNGLKPRPIKKVKKRRRRVIDLWREWLVPDNAYRRYSGLRGVYWYWLSRQIRYEEWSQWEGKCLTCLEIIENWTLGQCGHIIASGGCGEFLRFHRKNLTIQHPHCNNPRITKNAAALNAIHYDERYGQGAWAALYEMRKIEAKEPSQDGYRALIRGLTSYQTALAAQQSTLTPPHVNGD
jgi:hypothetical protein